MCYKLSRYFQPIVAYCVGAYTALAKLEPTATEAQLSKLTNDPKTGYLRHGKLNYVTFLRMYKTLHEETHKKTGSTNKCAGNPCKKGETCRRAKNAAGYICTAIHTGKQILPLALKKLICS